MHSNPLVQPTVSVAIPTNFKEAIRRVGLTKDELKSLATINSGRAFFDFAVTLGILLFIPVAFKLFMNPLGFLICLFASLHVFNRLASIIHMSDHNALLTSTRANSVVGSFAAFFMGYTRHGHRAVHHEHHIHLNTPNDPDRLWGVPDELVKEARRKWLSDLFLVSAAKRLAQYSEPRRHRGNSTSARTESAAMRILHAVRLQAPVFPVQIFLVAYYNWVIGWEHYLLLYVLPLLTIYPAIIRLRSMVEHSFETGYTPTSDEQRFIIRSTKANLLERILIAPLNGEYHLEHHLLPTVPYYNLPAARAIIESKGVRVPLAKGYIKFVFDKLSKEKASAPLFLGSAKPVNDK